MERKEKILAFAEIKGILVSMGTLHIADRKGKERGNHYSMEFLEGEINFNGGSAVNLDYDKAANVVNVILSDGVELTIEDLHDELLLKLCVMFKNKFEGTFDWFDLSPYRTVPDKFGTPIKKDSVVGFESADGKAMVATVTHISEENTLYLDKHRLVERFIIGAASQYGNRIEKVMLKTSMFTPNFPETISADKVSVLY